MKKFTKIILTIGLLASTSLFAGDVNSAFYPIENNDTPDYILNNTSNKQVKTTFVLAKSSISESILCSIYPEEHTDSPRISC